MFSQTGAVSQESARNPEAVRMKLPGKAREAEEVLEEWKD